MHTHRIPLTLLDPEYGWINAPVHVHDLHEQPVLMHFWSVDCGTCKEQLPDLFRFLGELQPRGLKVIGVHVPTDTKVRSDTNAIEAACKQWHLHHPVACDDGSIAQSYGVDALPAYLVFDRSGHLRHAVSGPKATGHLRHMLEKVLEEPAPAIDQFDAPSP